LASWRDFYVRERQSGRPHTNAFTLVELIFVLVLLGAFALVSTKLLVSSLKIPHEAGLKRDAVVRFESATSALRKDVWSAQSLASPDASTVIVESSAGKTTWHQEEDHIQRTPPDGHAQQWPLTQRLEFAVTGSTVKLTVIEDPAHRDEIEMISQMMLSKAEAGK